MAPDIEPVLQEQHADRDEHYRESAAQVLNVRAPRLKTWRLMIWSFIKKKSEPCGLVRSHGATTRMPLGLGGVLTGAGARHGRQNGVWG